MKELEKILLSIFLTVLILCFGFGFVCGNNVIIERQRIANGFCVSQGYEMGEYQQFVINPDQETRNQTYYDRFVCRNHLTSFPNDFVVYNVSGLYTWGYCETYATWR